MRTDAERRGLPQKLRMIKCPRAVVTINEISMTTRVAKLSCGHRCSFSRAWCHPDLAGRPIFCTRCERVFEIAEKSC